jgi:hypothetical protein
MTDSARSRIYCCLASAEAEWAAPHRSLEEAFAADRLNRVLQFLPCLLAAPGDQILLCNRPEDPLWRPPEGVDLRFLDDVDKDAARGLLEPWLWAQSRAASAYFGLPDQTRLMRKLASKATLVQWGLAPQGSCWVTSDEELRQWLSLNHGPAVAKRALDSSGRGHLLIKAPDEDSAEDLHPVCRIIEAEGGVVLQPWWERLFDFSSQWWCASTPAYVGSTIMRNSPRGRYLGSLVGPRGQLEEFLQDHWLEHVRHSHLVLQHAFELGYSGPVGIDAMMIATREGPRLVPIVELNPRHTMGWLACTLQKTQPGSWLNFEWAKSREEGPFPRTIAQGGQQEKIGVQPRCVWSHCAPSRLLQDVSRFKL